MYIPSPFQYVGKKNDLIQLILAGQFSNFKSAICSLKAEMLGESDLIAEVNDVITPKQDIWVKTSTMSDLGFGQSYNEGTSITESHNLNNNIVLLTVQTQAH